MSEHLIENPTTAAELKALLPELKTWMKKYAEEQTVLGKATSETKEKFDKLQDQVDGLDKKMASNVFADASSTPWMKEAIESNEFVDRLIAKKQGTARIELNARQSQMLMDHKTQFPRLGELETKTTISSSAVGYATTGVLQIDRQPDITKEARETLKISNLFQHKPTTLPYVDWIKIVTPVSVASPVVEASTKPESQLTFSSVSEKVKLVAVLLYASKQVLDDFTQLLSEINDQLGYYIGLALDQGYLFGDGTGENLHGIVPQAQAFQTNLLSAARGYSKIDIIRRAIQQIRRNKEIDPSFAILHPDDWADMEETKDSFGRYILNGPNANQPARIWNLPVVDTVTMTSGQFLVGSGNPAAAFIRDRMGLTIDISTEDNDNFRKNMCTIRAELRTVIGVRRPNSFVTGTLVSSPLGG